MPVDGEKTNRLHAALQASGDVAYDWDLRADTIGWFGPVADAFGLEEGAVLATGDAFAGAIHGDDLPLRLKCLARHFVTRERFECEYRIRSGTGFRWVHERGAAEFGASGRPVRLAGTLRAMTSRRLAEERLEYLASYDELTGHFNRSRLRQAIEQALAQAGRRRRRGGFLLVDIDHHARINDAFGFENGDAAIVSLGERLDRLVGPGDVIGRIEGDAFGVLLDKGGETRVQHLAERIIRSLGEQPLATAGGPVSATVSIGGIVFPEAAQSAQDVVARAETALAQAKRDGRNHFVLYRLSDEQRRDLRQDMIVARLVQRALAEERLVLAYQPVIEAKGGRIAFYECLLRLRKQTGEIVGAAEFVPVVEQLGLIRQIDRKVLSLAVAELVADPEVVLAINISGLTANDPAWLRALVALLKGKPHLARRLIVEITETAAIREIGETARFVASVRELGARVALDDFGAGYSSFRHLKALPVDMVKIDGSFVDEVAADERSRLFVRTLVGLAAGFGLTTVAEGIDSAETAAALAAEGVTYLQGFHLAEPRLFRAPVRSEGASPMPIPKPLPAQRTARRKGRGADGAGPAD
ncbi:diguanylate cyclase (GGDEF)-like protein [Constrictibacter sp. MBR-5]|jgi:diguanylate cyclase (GGDEF)-like protein|uniref:putative bifunctional diguanylate cyclase/phosphodiesterase n=1 Tax=Constrictibacter sp. MBR-5 TaxID=3156467 RepID=UPI0033954D56